MIASCTEYTMSTLASSDHISKLRAPSVPNRPDKNGSTVQLDSHFLYYKGLALVLAGGAFLVGKLGPPKSSGSWGGREDGAFLDGREGCGGFLLGRLGAKFSGSGVALCAVFRLGRLGG